MQDQFFPASSAMENAAALWRHDFLRMAIRLASAASEEHGQHYAYGKTHQNFMNTALVSPTLRGEHPKGTVPHGLIGTGVGSVREELFQHLVACISRARLAGDYLETGVHNGASAIAVGRAMACLNLTSNASRRLWLYDSWEGFPKTTIEDDGTWAATGVAGRAAGKNWGAPGGPNPSYVSNVLKGLHNVGVEDGSVVIRKGWFSQTFQQPRPEEIAFLHIDSDLYQSVKDTLEAFYPLVVEGGIVLFDDFGHFEGCRRAFYEYLVEKRHEYPLLERHGHSQAFFIKGKEHNRAGYGKDAPGIPPRGRVYDVCADPASGKPPARRSRHG